jgi:hypothetical protein
VYSSKEARGGSCPQVLQSQVGKNKEKVGNYIITGVLNSLKKNKRVWGQRKIMGEGLQVRQGRHL